MCCIYTVEPALHGSFSHTRKQVLLPYPDLRAFDLLVLRIASFLNRSLRSLDNRGALRSSLQLTCVPPSMNMGSSHCPAKDDPKSEWPALCPAIGPAYLYAVFFGLTSLAHLAQAVIYRKGYSWVLTMSGLWQTAAYIFRIISIKNVDSLGAYSAWFILILLAPLWTNAFVYMVLGRMVFNFTRSAKILGIAAWRFGLYFVLLDIVAFIIQAVGAAMASGDNIPQSQIFRGLHIYMGGIGMQQFFLLCFLVMAVLFQRQMNRDLPGAAKSCPLVLLYVIYAVLSLITIRIIFRLIEYANGYESGIPVHEAYQYILDSTPMLMALVLFNIVHPGRIMPGKEADLPSRKARKQAGKSHVWGRAGQYLGEAPQQFDSIKPLDP